MKERGILFSAPMVRAILAGAKTQTRRIVKLPSEHMEALQGFEAHYGGAAPTWDGGGADGYGGIVWERHDGGRSFVPARCPYGVIGDRLWVRETWQAIHVWVDPETGYGDDVDEAPSIPKERGNWWSVAYAASYPEESREDRGFAWRPGIHMPRWASRITLEVTGVRVERLQAIAEEDAKAEGAPLDDSPCDHTRLSCDETGCMGQTRRAGFCDLWCQINGADSWAANPWVWVVEFRLVEQP